MCGRFAQVYDDTKLKEKFRLEDISERIQPRFNLSPGMKVNAVTAGSGKTELLIMEWGFSEIHTKPLPSLIFNSRLDTIQSDSHLGKYLIRHRCVIPVSGFYEWSGKKPYYVKGASDILCLAGVYLPDETGNRCSVVTVDSQGPLKDLHHRMPLLLSGDEWAGWLESAAESACSELQDGELVPFRVSPAVNDVSFDSPACIEPFREQTLF